MKVIKTFVFYLSFVSVLVSASEPPVDKDKISLSPLQTKSLKVYQQFPELPELNDEEVQLHHLSPVLERHHKHAIEGTHEEELSLQINSKSLTPRQYAQLILCLAKLGISPEDSLKKPSPLSDSFLYFPLIQQISARKVRVLCLGGGGTRGLIIAHILNYIEKKTGRPIYKNFDLIVATSTGSIIGAGLTYNKPDQEELGTDTPPSPSPYTAEEIVTLYKTMACEIFKGYRYRSCYGLNGTQYDSAPAIKAFQSLYGERKLSEALSHFIVTAQNFSDSTACTFSSKIATNNTDNEEIDLLLWKAITAATAAPTYFDPYQIGNKIYGDGGVTNNNPSQIGVMKACEMFQVSPSQVYMLSVGTGEVKTDQNKSFSNLGGVNWLGVMSDNIFNGKSQDLMTQELFKASKNNDIFDNQGMCLYLQPQLALGQDKLADYSPKFFSEMTTIAENLLEDTKELLDPFIEKHLTSK